MPVCWCEYVVTKCLGHDHCLDVALNPLGPFPNTMILTGSHMFDYWVTGCRSDEERSRGGHVKPLRSLLGGRLSLPTGFGSWSF